MFETIYLEEVYSIPYPVTVVIDVPWNDLKEGHRLLLSRILQAVKLSIHSVRIIHQPHFDLSSWHEKPPRAIAFVSALKGLTNYEVIETGETSIIFSDPLEMLNKDEPSKRKLWATLKTMFLPG